MADHKYDCRIDFDADNAHTRMIRLVGERKRVLELGCATGYMSKVLVERFGCTVTGVERDPEAAEAARKACSRVIVGDLETLDYRGELGEERFDVVVCGDVLEHLRDSVRVLDALRPFLAPGGYVVASVPNVAHVSVIAELLEGRFPYRPLGLLDDSHLRFFTRESLYECFETAGYAISHLERFRLEPEATEFRTDLSRFPAELARRLRAHEESTTYQFILTAHPAPEGGRAAVLKDALAGEAARAVTGPAAPGGPEDAAGYWRSRLEGVIEAILGRMQFLEEERNRRTGELEALRERVAQQESQIRGHEAHIRHLQEEVGRREAHFQRELAAREHEMRSLHAHLSDITSGTGWKLLERYRRLRLRLCPPGSRRDRLYRRTLALFVPVARRRPGSR